MSGPSDDDFKMRRAWRADLPAPTPYTVAGCHVVMEGVTEAGRPWLRCHLLVWAPELREEIAEALRVVAENLATGVDLAAESEALSGEPRIRQELH